MTLYVRKYGHMTVYSHIDSHKLKLVSQLALILAFKYFLKADPDPTPEVKADPDPTFEKKYGSGSDLTKKNTDPDPTNNYKSVPSPSGKFYPTAQRYVGFAIKWQKHSSG